MVKKGKSFNNLISFTSSCNKTAMEAPKSSATIASTPLLSLSSFIQQHWFRLGAELAIRVEETKRTALKLASNFPSLPSPSHSTSSSSSSPLFLPFASVSQSSSSQLQGKKGSGFAAAAAVTPTLNSGYIAKTLTGTSVYTVSNLNNEFVLISDPNSSKSIGLLCFRREDAEAFLAQVKTRRRELKGGAKVVPITLEQVYMLKVEGIAFRFLPDPVQVKNALELKSSNAVSGFDGVPVFQSDLLVAKRKNKRYCPIYFRKEDIETELNTVRASKGPGASQSIMVGSLEDVLKKMEMSERNSGWADLIFIPPGRSHSQHIRETANA